LTEENHEDIDASLERLSGYSLGKITPAGRRFGLVSKNFYKLTDISCE
jgi:hypothetical protein